jgi:ABC-2 type transport system ATP-binding protein
MRPVVRTDRLTKDYSVGFWRQKPRRALDGLTLEVQAGEVFGLLGPNGAGKTTTLKLLLDLVRPSSGRVEILGCPVADFRVRQRVGYLPENPYFYDYLTAEELLGYFAGLFGYRGADRRARVSRLLDEVEIGAERREPLRRFSKGMLQRVGLAQALLNDPEVIVLDEPMSGLDPLGRRSVRQRILRLRDEGRTVFFSSHILGDAEALCSRVAILASGRLVSTGRLTDMLAFDVTGWELVVSGLDERAASRCRAGGLRVTAIGEDRFALEVPAGESPEAWLGRVVGLGGRLVSFNPLRTTLEDFFVRQVGRGAPADEVRSRPVEPACTGAPR